MALFDMLSVLFRTKIFFPTSNSFKSSVIKLLHSSLWYLSLLAHLVLHLFIFIYALWRLFLLQFPPPTFPNALMFHLSFFFPVPRWSSSLQLMCFIFPLGFWQPAFQLLLILHCSKVTLASPFQCFCSFCLYPKGNFTHQHLISQCLDGSTSYVLHFPLVSSMPPFLHPFSFFRCYYGVALISSLFSTLQWEWVADRPCEPVTTHTIPYITALSPVHSILLELLDCWKWDQ